MDFVLNFRYGGKGGQKAMAVYTKEEWEKLSE